MVTRLCMFHPPKGMLRLQKNFFKKKKLSSGNLANVRIKTLMSYREITVSAGASGLQLWKKKSLVSHYSCVLPKVLEFPITVSVSYHSSVHSCRKCTSYT